MMVEDAREGAEIRIVTRGDGAESEAMALLAVDDYRRLMEELRRLRELCRRVVAISQYEQPEHCLMSLASLADEIVAGEDGVAGNAAL